MRNGYAALASSVFLVTERDIRKAKTALKRNPGNKNAMDTLSEIRNFLKTDWAGVLEGVAEIDVVEKLKEMIDDK